MRPNPSLRPTHAAKLERWVLNENDVMIRNNPKNSYQSRNIR